MTRPVALIVLDGFGLGDGGPADATALAHAPFFARAAPRVPDGEDRDVGRGGRPAARPDGQLRGRPHEHRRRAHRRHGHDAHQQGDRATAASSRTRRSRSALDARGARAGGRSTCSGLVSDGGVHSHQDAPRSRSCAHCRRRGVRPVAARLPRRPRHAAVARRSATCARSLPHVEAADGRIATVIGRYWAMDRDNRWERVERAYDAIVLGEGTPRGTRDSRPSRPPTRADETDEFVEPTRHRGRRRARATATPCIFFNFRADRARELTKALTSAQPAALRGQARAARRSSKLGLFVCMTEYDAAFGLPVAFRSEMPRAHPRRGARRARPHAAPHRRDREVRARHVLLQRRARGAVPGRGARPVPSPPTSRPTTRSPR